MVREYFYVYGAVSPREGQHDSLVLPAANSECMSIFLNEVSLRHPNEFILMFVDQACWHTSKQLQVPSNIELALLPPYSPELNPQEQVWDELREKCCGNKYFKSLDALADTISQGLQKLEASPYTLTSLTQRSWQLNL